MAQFSPINATALKPPIEDKSGKLRAPRADEKLPAKLKGIPVRHFAAFFATKSRENDYLWGRLDGPELILRLLADIGRGRQETTLATVGGKETPPPPHVAEALNAVLASETDLHLVISRGSHQVPPAPPPGSPGAVGITTRPTVQ